MEETKKTRREAFAERLREKHPEKEFGDDEALFSQIGEDYDAYDKSMASYKKDEEELMNLFTADPRAASFLTDWRAGQDPAVALMRRFGPELRDALDDPDKVDALAEAQADYLERIAKNKELEKQYEDNLRVSLEHLDKAVSEGNLTDEEIDAAMDKLKQVSMDFIVGKISPETIDLFLKSANYDKDVEAARYDGEVNGKVAQAEERLRKPGYSQLPPTLGGGSVKPQAPRKSMGALDRYGDDRKDIWEGAKRIRRS